MTQAKTTKLQLVVDVVVKHDCHEGKRLAAAQLRKDLASLSVNVIATVGNKVVFADAKVGAMRWKK